MREKGWEICMFGIEVGGIRGGIIRIPELQEHRMVAEDEAPYVRTIHQGVEHARAVAGLLSSSMYQRSSCSVAMSGKVLSNTAQPHPHVGGSHPCLCREGDPRGVHRRYDARDLAGGMTGRARGMQPSFRVV